jgi:hypothetical protein
VTGPLVNPFDPSDPRRALGVSRRMGQVVDTVNMPATLTVGIGGDLVNTVEIPCLSSYVPKINDVVVVLATDSDMIVLGAASAATPNSFQQSWITSLTATSTQTITQTTTYTVYTPGQVTFHLDTRTRVRLLTYVSIGPHAGNSHYFVRVGWNAGTSPGTFSTGGIATAVTTDVSGFTVVNSQEAAPLLATGDWCAYPMVWMTVGNINSDTIEGSDIYAYNVGSH